MTDMLMALFLVFPQQTLLLQMNEMKSQVDEVRDLAITLMSRSDRFTPMVEPELTHLNQRWEEVAQLLKVRARWRPWWRTCVPHTVLGYATFEG